jgi:Predicted oxidoreductases of the aldo/keto reductase family
VPEEAEKLMKTFAPDASVPSWAIRFASSQDGVIMVLSGMNTMEQVLVNTSYMRDFKPLNEEEYKVIEKVSESINANTVVPCIACKSCEKA